MITLTVTINDEAREFVLARTNAPKAYDYGAVIELYDATGAVAGAAIDRYLLIPDDLLSTQIGRNLSGMHSCETDGLWLDAKDASLILWDRLAGKAQA